jgi:cobyrinic acid a,c-diamide synthase
MERHNQGIDTPAVVVGGSSSGVGKTLVATAIMYHFRRKGFSVQPFKVGPDYIDPSYHQVVCNRQSYNLDVWMMGENGVIEKFCRASSGADIAVIEGVMGVFDGVSGKSDLGSTAHVARLLDAPVILVVDAGRAGGSIAALIHGFINFDKRLNVSGIVLNNVASRKHLKIIRDTMSGKVDVPIVGVISRNSVLGLKERHLGLIPVLEIRSAKKKIMFSSQVVAKSISFTSLKNLAARKRSFIMPLHSLRHRIEPIAKIAIAKDESFNFYYADTVESLEKNNAQIVYFSPVNDNNLPDGISGIILGGGFPEILADKLEKNYHMKKAILQAAQQGMPIYAECGGLMYLTKNIIVSKKGKKKKSKMVGLIEADTSMGSRLTLNYTEADNRSVFFKDIKKIRGHEFHYSQIIDIGKDSDFAYTLRRGNGIIDKKDGIVVYNCLASYMHLHFGGDERLGRRIVELSRIYSRR